MSEGEWTQELTPQAIQEQINAGPDDTDGRVRLERFRAVCRSHQLLAARLARLREERDKAVSVLATVQNAAKVLVAGADRRVLDATKHEPAARVAIATLDSEREMNAVLTEENERLRAALSEAEQRISRLEAELETEDL